MHCFQQVQKEILAVIYEEEEEMAEGLEEEEAVDWGSDVDSEPEIILVAHFPLKMKREGGERRFGVKSMAEESNLIKELVVKETLEKKGEDLEEEVHFEVDSMEEKVRGTVEPMEVESSLELDPEDEQNLKKKLKKSEEEVKHLREKLKMGGNSEVKGLEEKVTEVEVQPCLKKKNKGKQKRGSRGKGSSMRRTESRREMFNEVRFFFRDWVGGWVASELCAQADNVSCGSIAHIGGA